MVGFAGLLAAAAVWGGVASGQEQPQSDPGAAATVADIEVTQAKDYDETRKEVEAFVGRYMLAPPGQTLARWTRPVCIATGHLREPHAQAIIDRIARRIFEVGGDVAGPGCRADVIIVGAEDGAATARDLVERDRQSFVPAVSSTDLGEKALESFMTVDQPVRWWHVNMPVEVRTGTIATTLKGEEPIIVNVSSGSHLNRNVRNDMARVFIIVEFAKLPADLRMTALVDYLAFLAMAQVSPDKSFDNVDTVLNALDDPARYDGMTEWDMEYLKALYRVRGDRHSVAHQTQDISLDVLRQRQGLW